MPRAALSNLEWGEHELRLALRRAARTNLHDLPSKLHDWLIAGGPPPQPEFAPLEHEPHALGWLHQHLGEWRRRQDFAAHHHREQKHLDSTSTTQLYTPRWVADILADRCFELAGTVTALDPACGGGQLLLAWVDRLIQAGIDPSLAFLHVRGVDLDPLAVTACREGLLRHAAKTIGTVPDRVRQHIDSQIVCADALHHPIQPADVVLSNPPYMGRRSMSPALKAELDAYAPFHIDLFSAFIKRCAELSKVATGILAQQSFWYVAQFEPARNQLLQDHPLNLFVHLGSGVFRSLSGEKASVVAFVLGGNTTPEFIDLRAGRAQQKRKNWPNASSRFLDVQQFKKIPGTPLAHWLPDASYKAFHDFPRLGDFFEIPPQNKTGDNDRFVQRLSDVELDQLVPNELLPDQLQQAAHWATPQNWSNAPWPQPNWRYALYSKGGPAAPWWGNWLFALDVSPKARTFYAQNPTSNLVAAKNLFRPGLCYTDFGGTSFCARWLPQGAIADMTGPAIFEPQNDRKRLLVALAILNSSAARSLLNALNPTLHYQVRDLRNLPFPDTAFEHPQLADWAEQLVSLTRAACALDPDALEARIAIKPDVSFETIDALAHLIEAEVAKLYQTRPGLPPVHLPLKKIREKTS